MLVDTHAHIYEEYYPGQIEAVLARATAAGVGRLVVPAVDLASSAEAVRLSRRRTNLYAAVGIHPGEVDNAGESDLEQLENFLLASRENRIVAVGEAGIDYHYTRANAGLQKVIFKAQIKLACRYDLPLIIHDREAHKDSLDCLLEAQADGYLRPRRPGVFHCYSGSVEFMQSLLKLGFYIGIDGPVTFKNAGRLKEVVAAVPADRLLLETDSPYLTPEPYRGKRNEPANLVHIAEAVAAVRGVTVADLAEETGQNADRLFDLSAF